MTTDFALRFNDFTGGEWGGADPSKQPVNRWTGLNMTLYRSGLLGVRPGALRSTNFDDVQPGDDPGPKMFDAYGDDLVVVTDRLRLLAFPDPTIGGLLQKQAWDAYPGTPTEWVDNAIADGVLYTLVNGTLFRHGIPPATTTVAVTTPAPFSQIARWGLFLVGVDRNVPWRIWFSLVDPTGPHYDTWPANNYLDVGTNEPIVALLPILNTLWCGRISGWWSVSGVLGDQAYVREVGIGNGPSDARLASVTTDSRAAYYGTDPAPHIFNTATVFIADPQTSPSIAPLTAQSVVATPTGRRILFGGDRGDPSNVLLWDSPTGRYERHSFLNPPAAWAPSDVRNAYRHPPGVVCYAEAFAGTDDNFSVYTWRHDAERPGQGDKYTTWDDTEGEVTFPSWFDGQGRQVMVRDVIVNFRKWGQNFSGPLGINNKMTLQVRADGQYQAGASEWSDPRRWIEPRARSLTTGEDDSWRCGVGDQGWGNGFTVRLSQMQGVALREVVVLVNVRSPKV